SASPTSSGASQLTPTSRHAPGTVHDQSWRGLVRLRHCTKTAIHTIKAVFQIAEAVSQPLWLHPATSASKGKQAKLAVRITTPPNPKRKKPHNLPQRAGSRVRK